MKAEGAEVTIDASQYKDGTVFKDGLDSSYEVIIKDGKLVLKLEKVRTRILIFKKMSKFFYIQNLKNYFKLYSK